MLSYGVTKAKLMHNLVNPRAITALVTRLLAGHQGCGRLFSSVVLYRKNMFQDVRMGTPTGCVKITVAVCLSIVLRTFISWNSPADLSAQASPID